MRKKLKYYIAVFATAALVLTGCTSSQTSTTETGDTTETTTESGVAATSTTSSQIVVDTEFTANDLEVGYDESTATEVTLNGSDISVSGDGATAEDGVLTISSEGTYVLSGTLEDGQILVDAGDSDKIQIVLNGVTINNNDNAAIYIKSADKVFITLNEGTTNTLTDGSEYVQADDNNVDGVIYSKADLTINGSGTLNVTGNYKHGIVSKDDLVITGGNINVTAVKDALNGKDAVKVKEATLTLSAETGNGIQSKNDEDETKGYVYIASGTITVTNCQEGIEGTVIQIDGGTIDITAQDDGMNAASATSDTTDTDTQPAAPSDTSSSTESDGLTNMSVTTTSSDSNTTDSTSSATTTTSESDSDFARGGGGPGGGSGGFGGQGGGGGEFGNDTNCLIVINGGTITVNASGDGIDSNGSISITGGTLYVNGPTNSGNGALDYNGTADITGGTVVAVGSTGMAQGFSDSSTQYSLLYNLSETSSAGTEITLTDADGNVVVSYTPDKEYQSVVISSPELSGDATYTLTSGDQTADITLSSVVTSNGQQGGGFGGQGGMDSQGGMNGGGQGGPGNRGSMPGDNSTEQSTETSSTEG